MYSLISSYEDSAISKVFLQNVAVGQLLLIDRITRSFCFSKNGDPYEMDRNGTKSYIGSTASGQKHFILCHKPAIRYT